MLKNKKFDESREFFEKSLDICPDLKICFFLIGNSYAQESNSIYDRALELENDVKSGLDTNNEVKKLKLDAESTLAKAIPMWGYFIENMPEYSWMILPTLKDALKHYIDMMILKKCLLMLKIKMKIMLIYWLI